ncbi:hypothetical protein OX283_001340 [Flavobacterium sp. SUN052]|uniref:hypothetical protein n=1 Tax=Flavobacterium sp. SUN052 TaxID=3002441 RepID=UPI00237E2472|nr:hypothetical protein [Flavobacterium sp. SUN052]MEC4003286.1 hypothetical protein [Flavobacterium sp. SUN052]
MKKRLEAELISIAHRILKLKNKSEIDQLYLETRKLYETLSVLKFYGDNYEQVKSEISNEELEEKLSDTFEEKSPEVVLDAPKPIQEEVTAIIPSEEEVVVNEEESVEENETVVAENETTEESVIIGEITLDEEEIDEEEPVVDAKTDLDFEPIFELAAEAPIEDEVDEIIETPKKESKQISFEDLLGENYTEPVFVKPNDIVVPESLKSVIDEKPLSLNDQHLKTINIGLNDKMAFVKHLFADDNEDYNRVLSQLNTFSTYEEAKDFIEEIIKPDYNNWDGADDYAERFLEIVAKKFS